MPKKKVIVEVKPNCCKKCVHCFDEYQHFNWWTFPPTPPLNNKRYYCNHLHKYVLPTTVRKCFKKW